MKKEIKKPEPPHFRSLHHLAVLILITLLVAPLALAAFAWIAKNSVLEAHMFFITNVLFSMLILTWPALWLLSLSKDPEAFCTIKWNKLFVAPFWGWITMTLAVVVLIIAFFEGNILGLIPVLLLSCICLYIVNFYRTFYRQLPPTREEMLPTKE